MARPTWKLSEDRKSVIVTLRGNPTVAFLRLVYALSATTASASGRRPLGAPGHCSVSPLRIKKAHFGDMAVTVRATSREGSSRKSRQDYRLPLAIDLLSKKALDGGRTQARTVDPLIKSQLLYQLSYAPIEAA